MILEAEAIFTFLPKCLIVTALLGVRNILMVKVNFAYLKTFLVAPFWRNRLLVSLFVTSLLVNVGIWVVLGVYIKPSDYPIPLHYNIYFGIDLTGSARNALHLPIIGLLVILINLILAYWFYLKDRLVSYVLSLATCAVQVFVAIGAVTVIYINL